MKQLVLEIPEREYHFFMKVIKNFSFVKAKPFSSEKARILSDLEEAVHYVNLAKKGKYKPKPLSKLLDEV